MFAVIQQAIQSALVHPQLMPVLFHSVVLPQPLLLASQSLSMALALQTLKPVMRSENASSSQGGDYGATDHITRP